MSAINDGGPAFPRSGFLSEMDNEVANRYDNKPDQGMSLRDYFAAAALQGILSNQWIVEKFGATNNRVANDCYEFADAMLKAREARP